MQTVRQALKRDVTQAHEGLEGASLLFYYLFDDWRAVYLTVAEYSLRLGRLVCTLPPLFKIMLITNSETKSFMTW